MNIPIKIGPIKKVFSGKKLLLFSWVSDNSPLKSQFFCLFKTADSKGNNLYLIKIGKGWKNDKSIKLGIYKRSLYSYIRNKSFVWIGISQFKEEKF